MNDQGLFEQTYHIEAEIGSGGGGIVYKAWHKRLNKYVVIKELKGGSAIDEESQRNEVEALKNVKSAYLPQVFDFITYNMRIFTVMEYIKGESLDRLLGRNYRFTTPQIVKWYRQLASALETIHQHGIAHRDIKPANIMVLPNGNVCLIDFNAALVGGSDVRLISRSLGYASPEQYKIYEKFKNRSDAPIQYIATQGLTQRQSSGEMTELVGDTVGSVPAAQDPGRTELVGAGGNALLPAPDRTELVQQNTTGIDWKLSDIYSLGATMYHLLTGVHPPEHASSAEPIDSFVQCGEGLTYIIERSMNLIPQERFPSAAALSATIRDIRRFDHRWRMQRARQIAAAVILPVTFAVFAGVSLLGMRTMAQEKEERYYEALCDISSGSEPQSAFDEAEELFGDRIDQYCRMAERLWNDGQIEECRQFIEENLGLVAEFSSDKASYDKLGGIYHLLGNCYYCRPGDPDPVNACNYFEIAVQYVKDDPQYYCDYAVALARTGDTQHAEQIMEKAQVLHLPQDSLCLLNGELKLVEGDLSGAAEYLEQAAAETTDNYIRYRAYHSLDLIYTSLGQPENSVKLLEEGVNRLPAGFVFEMKERLAQAYISTGDNEKALSVLEELCRQGVPQFSVMQNMAIILENQRNFELAAKVLDQMADLFPNDYRVPMRRALLEADYQSSLENEDRDYSKTQRYYIEAEKLYSSVAAIQSDPEMQRLETLIEQLRINHWIDQEG